MDAHEVTHPRTESQYTLRCMRKVLCPSLQDLKTKTLKHRFISIIIAPINLLVGLTLPVSDQDKEDEKDTDGRFEERQRTPQNWDRWLLITQSFIAPQFILAIVWHQISSDPSRLLLPACICLAGSALVAVAVMLTSNTKKRPQWFRFVSIAGFAISIARISTVADEMVSIFKALGVILNVPEAILGLTVFAVGNSLDDLAANVTVAQHRRPVMALSACFGGPLLNILLGISISGFYIFVKTTRTEHPVVAIDLHTGQTLFITAATAIVILIAILAMML